MSPHASPPAGFLQPWEEQCADTVFFPPEIYSPCTEDGRGMRVFSCRSVLSPRHFTLLYQPGQVCSLQSCYFSLHCPMSFHFPGKHLSAPPHPQSFPTRNTGTGPDRGPGGHGRWDKHLKYLMDRNGPSYVGGTTSCSVSEGNREADPPPPPCTNMV